MAVTIITQHQLPQSIHRPQSQILRTKRLRRKSRAPSPPIHTKPMMMATIPEDNSVEFVRVPLADSPDLDREALALINEARFYNNHNLPALIRVPSMDEMAREHARAMAKKGSVYHSVSNVEELQSRLQSTMVGENIHCGKSVMEMHAAMMNNKNSIINRVNALSSRFDQMGSGIVLGEDGLLYSVQLFRTSS